MNSLKKLQIPMSVYAHVYKSFMFGSYMGIFKIYAL